MSVSRLDLGAFAAKWGWPAAASALVGLALAGCANETVQHYPHGREHFSQAKYGRASSKVVADGQPVPKGGGQYLVGRPYRVAGHTYYPAEMSSYTAVGMASWYGAAFHGRRTANGEVYDMASVTAAHPTMPLPSYARVTNLRNGYSIIVRVNDRGPYHGGRVMDVSSRTADVLGFKGEGTARIKVEYLGQAPMEGSDDAVLLASLRTDGSPATLNGYSSGTMLASAEPGPSIFGAFWGSSGSSAPEPAPAQRPDLLAQPVAPPSRPEPQSEPIRVASVEPALPPEPIRAPAARTATSSHRSLAATPLPPPRPFDLSSARAPSPAAVAPPRPKAATLPSRATLAAVAPPRRAVGDKALYFNESARERRDAFGAFDRLKPPQD